MGNPKTVSGKIPVMRIAAVIILFACAAAISIILKNVYNMGPSGIDIAIQNMFFSMRGGFSDILISALTHCGDTITIIILCAVLLALPSRLKYGVPVSLAALTGLAIYKPMKHIFTRARPDQALHLVEQGGYSFPSGHSVTSVIVYGLLVFLIRKHCRNTVLKNFLTAVCTVFAVTIGPSRIYVGVHWPTDVLCGWLIGAGVLITYITILERIYRKNESLQ